MIETTPDVITKSLKWLRFSPVLLGIYYLLIYTNQFNLPFPLELSTLPMFVLALGSLTLILSIFLLGYIFMTSVMRFDPCDIGYEALFHSSPWFIKRLQLTKANQNLLSGIVNYITFFCISPLIITFFLFNSHEYTTEIGFLSLVFFAFFFSFVSTRRVEPKSNSIWKTFSTSLFYYRFNVFLIDGALAVVTLFSSFAIIFVMFQISEKTIYISTFYIFFFFIIFVFHQPSPYTFNDLDILKKPQTNAPPTITLNEDKTQTQNATDEGIDKNRTQKVTEENRTEKIEDVKKISFFTLFFLVCTLIIPDVGLFTSKAALKILGIGGLIERSFYTDTTNAIKLPKGLIKECYCYSIDEADNTCTLDAAISKKNSICQTKPLKVVLDIGGTIYVQGNFFGKNDAVISIPKSGLNQISHIIDDVPDTKKQP